MTVPSAPPIFEKGESGASLSPEHLTQETLENVQDLVPLGDVHSLSDVNRRSAEGGPCDAPDTRANDGRERMNLKQPNRLTRSEFLRTETGRHARSTAPESITPSYLCSGFDVNSF